MNAKEAREVANENSKKMFKTTLGMLYKEIKTIAEDGEYHMFIAQGEGVFYGMNEKHLEYALTELPKNGYKVSAGKSNSNYYKVSWE